MGRRGTTPASRASPESLNREERSRPGGSLADLIWAADTLGGVIRRARDARNLTQRELAQRCSISPMYVSQIENGDRVPSVKICRLLAKALELDERRLLLLAYRTSAPEEIKDLLAHEEPAPYGDRIGNGLLNLVRAASILPDDKRQQLTRFWEESLRLMTAP